MLSHYHGDAIKVLLKSCHFEIEVRITVAADDTARLGLQVPLQITRKRTRCGIDLGPEFGADVPNQQDQSQTRRNVRKGDRWFVLISIDKGISRVAEGSQFATCD